MARSGGRRRAPPFAIAIAVLVAGGGCARLAPDDARLLGAVRLPPPARPAGVAVRESARHACLRPGPGCRSAPCALSDPPLGVAIADALACLPTRGAEESETRCDDDSCTVTRSLGGHTAVSWISLLGGTVAAVFTEVRLPVGGGSEALAAWTARWAAAAGPGRALPARFARIGALVDGGEWRGPGAVCDLWLESRPDGDALEVACHRDP